MLHVTTHDRLALQRQLAAAGHAMGLPVHAATPTLPLGPLLDKDVVHGGQVATARDGVLLLDTARFAGASKSQQAALEQLLDKSEPALCGSAHTQQSPGCPRGVVWAIHDAHTRSKAPPKAAQADLVLHDCVPSEQHDHYWGALDAPVDTTLQWCIKAARACSTPGVAHAAQHALQRCYMELRGRHKVTHTVLHTAKSIVDTWDAHRARPHLGPAWCSACSDLPVPVPG